MKLFFSSLCLCLTIFSSCSQKSKPKIEVVSLSSEPAELGPQKLSEWGFFDGDLADLKPANGIIPYDLNTPLFSDYAYKLRFIKLPTGLKASYHPTETFDFPVGSILIKNFYYPDDFHKPEGKRTIIETRVLIREEVEWKALTYVWNNEQAEAYLEIAGASVDISWRDKSGTIQNIPYSVPNLVQCKSCHDFKGKMLPIGPTARQLNRKYQDNPKKPNQLAHWMQLHILDSLPPISGIPRLAVWDDDNNGTLSERARAWLEINCAHCHRKEGPAKNTGLYLLASQNDPYKIGINKPPVAAGRGSAGLRFAIVPGDAEASILFQRIKSLDPGIMMPELGRKLNHDEGVDLIKTWIESL
ncbi:MAG: SO2930 family diheme c-type cytochrome [Cyclobacteriaceae bacterium]